MQSNCLKILQKLHVIFLFFLVHKLNAILLSEIVLIILKIILIK